MNTGEAKKLRFDPQQHRESPKQIDTNLSSEESVDIRPLLGGEWTTIFIKGSKPIVLPTPILEGHFSTLQKWEGYVSEVSETEFIAVIKDLSNRENLQEVVTFDRNEIADEDQELIEQGAIFYWYIGYQDEIGGKKRSSSIRFRRLSGFSKDELDSAKKEVNDLRKYFLKKE